MKRGHSSGEQHADGRTTPLAGTGAITRPGTPSYRALPPRQPAYAAIYLRTLQQCKQLSTGGVSFLGVVVCVEDERTVQRRDGSDVRLASVLVSDHTDRYMQVKGWAEHCDYWQSESTTHMVRCER